MRSIGGVYCIIALSVLMIFSLSSLPASYLAVEPSQSAGNEGSTVAGTPHSPIYIDGDGNFSATASAEGWSGNGSSLNPYIIDRLDIDLGGAPGHGISISNTRVHVVIRDCNLTGASVDPGCGIYLYNVSNSELINNTCIDNYIGIRLDFSTSNSLYKNNCTGNNINIYLYSFSDSNTLSENTCTSDSNAGIVLYRSNSNSLVNNTCKDSTNIGIYIARSDSNTLSDNVFTSNTNYGIYINDDSDLNDILWNVFADSSTNGYDKGTGNVFEYNYWSDYTGTDANQDGLGDTPYTFTGNSDPHPLVDLPTPPTWTQSPVDRVLEFGSLIVCDLNATTHLPLTWSLNSSLFSIDDEGVVTSWFSLPIGVYRLEVVGTNMRDQNITGNFRVTIQDTSPPHWIVEPSDQVLQHGESLDYQLPAGDLSGIDHWTLNDTSHFTITATFYNQGGTARLVNATALEPGVYPLSITVFDRYDNSISAVFSITVLEATMTTTTGTEGLDPVLMFVLGTGVGGGAFIVIVLAVLRRRADE
ncbi:MAG: right-handed parallel beta-helix repeat-containing protein [Candidatus Thorarchaeota archaeon]|nr:MAG: right-handed parallel beta-helix repeat-containing protein [Candidatus Thorarchaeota archaeon]